MYTSAHKAFQCRFSLALITSKCWVMWLQFDTSVWSCQIGKFAESSSGIPRIDSACMFQQPCSALLSLTVITRTISDIHRHFQSLWEILCADAKPLITSAGLHRSRWRIVWKEKSGVDYKTHHKIHDCWGMSASWHIRHPHEQFLQTQLYNMTPT